MQKENTPFDFERLKAISSDDVSFENDLLSSYLNDMELRYKKLSELVAEQNLESIQSMSHSIKGASYSVGAQRVGDEAFGIETSAKGNDMPGVRQRLPMLLIAINETKSIVKEFLVSR
jgi:HPt (histidine-containing phosphotransfer) domain-containing protein